ncbi:MAG: CdaR family protein [Defluviitaleaceae bacterium]|nr:CdaR family protein [Defluviitaleaceae bacterium]
MVNAIKVFFTKNIEWKLISLCVSTILWFTVISSENPMSTEFFQVPLTIRNDQALMANNLVLMNRQELSAQTMGISVRATRSDLETLRMAMGSFRAYVDFGPIDISHTMDIDEPMNINVRYEFPSFLQAGNFTIMSPPGTVEIVLDRHTTQSFPVHVLRDGDVMPGFIHHTPIISPANVSVSGPETVISLIDQVQTVVDLSDADTDIARFSTIQAIDVNGTDITNRVSLNISSVMVQIDVSRYGEVPVLWPEIQGSPAEGFVFTGVSVSPSVIEVVGDENSLHDMQQHGLRLRPVSIEGRSESFDVVNDMREYLIDTDLHIRNLTPHETVTRVIIEPLVTVEFTFGVDDIDLSFDFYATDPDEDGNYQDAIDSGSVEIAEDELVVAVFAAQSIANGLTAEDIHLSATITGAALSYGSVPVHVDAPEGVTQTGELRIEISAVLPEAGD